MKSKRFIPLIVLIGLVAGCSQLPQTERHSDELDEWRAQYIKHNPDGEFNRFILKGQVAPGMNALEVLASWGVPNSRRRVVETGHEYWTYYEDDPHSDQVTTYAFVFERGVISGWAEGAGRMDLDALTPEDLANLFQGSATGAMASRTSPSSTNLGGDR